MEIKRVAAINDISGLGRCSLTVALPIISAMGHQVCPVPTALLSAHTGFKKYSFFDFTNYMNDYISVWNELDFEPDMIYSGFLGSAQQIDIVSQYISSKKNSVILVDPVMGDDGVIYKTYSNEMCQRLLELCKKADIITPNLTEACILTGREYKGNALADLEIESLLSDVLSLGVKKVVITGIHQGESLVNAGFDGEMFIHKTPHTYIKINGTGDIFASTLAGGILSGMSFKDAVEKAGDFTAKAVEYTKKIKANPKEGVAFEPLVKQL